MSRTSPSFQSSSLAGPKVLLALALASAAALALASCKSDSKPAAAAPTPPPTLAAPNLANADPQQLTKDTALAGGSIITFTNSGGGSLTNCAASANIPGGLVAAVSSNMMTCQITGTPTAATSGAVTVTVTATNATGVDGTPAMVQITVTDPNVINLQNLAAQTFDKDAAVSTPVQFSNLGGGGLSACTASPNIPDGLTVAVSSDMSTCEISGTPMAATTGAVTVTVTATNSTGSATATVDITVRDVASVPSFEVINETGVMAPNFIVVSTWGRNSSGAIDWPNPDNTVGPGDSDKMKYSISTSGPTRGEVTVEVTNNSEKMSFFTTLFESSTGADPKDPSPTRDHVGLQDLSRYNGLNISFELQSDNWGPYAVSDGMVFKVDHFVKGASANEDVGFCDCERSLDLSDAGTSWKRFDMSVSNLAASPSSLDLTKIKTGIVLIPQINLQFMHADGGTVPNAVTFKVRNVRWGVRSGGPAPAPSLADITAKRELALDVALSGAEIITFVNSGEPLGATGTCAASANIPDGLAAELTSDNTSCRITGTPTAVTTQDVTVTVTGTAANGQADTATVVIAVTDTAPAVVTVVMATEAASAGTGVRITFSSTEGGTAYLVVTARDVGDSLTAAQIKTQAVAPPTGQFGASRVFAGDGAVAGGVAATGLAVGTDYSAYIVVEDASGNLSAVSTVDFSTGATADTMAATATVSVPSATARAGSAVVEVATGESADFHVLVLAASETAPDVAAVMAAAGRPAGPANLVASGYSDGSAAGSVTVDGLAQATAYTAYAVAIDTAGNVPAAVAMANFTSNTPPTAAAGADQTVAFSAMVTLDASASADAEDDAAGTALSYAWAQTAGTTVTLSDAAVAMPSFDASPADDAGETLTFGLTVTDSNGDSHTDSVDITVMKAPTSTDPHASITVAAATSTAPAGYGTAVTLFDDGFEGSLLTGAAAYEDNPADEMHRGDPTMGQVRVSVEDLADGTYDEVVQMSTGTETQAVHGVQADPAADLSAHVAGVLRFDVRVTDLPDDPDAHYRIKLASQGADGTGEVSAEEPLGGQRELGTDMSWRTVSVDLRQGPWNDVVLSKFLRLEVFPNWGSAAGSVMQLDNIRLYPLTATAAGAAPDLADVADAQSIVTGQSLDVRLANSGGIGITACAPMPALPAGLTAAPTDNGDSCRISGSPTAVTPSASYTITATNVGGADASPATITIAVALGIPATGDFNVVGGTGVVDPNKIEIITFGVDGTGDTIFTGVNTRGAGTSGTAGTDHSAKMQFSVDDVTGVVTVTLTNDVTGESFFTTVFSDAPTDTSPRNLSRFKGGKIRFDIRSNDWGAYAIENGFWFKVDHTSGEGFCNGCDMGIDLRNASINTWMPQEFDIDALVAASLDLNNIKTGIVLWPNLDHQVVNDLSPLTGRPITFDLRNIRWEEPAATTLVSITDTVIFYTGFGPYDLSFESAGGGGITACSASPTLPTGLGVSQSDNGDTCEITGSPTAVAAADDYTITATAGTHMPTATVRLEVAEGLPATGDFVVIGSSGPVAPNIVDIANFPVGSDGGTDFGGTVNTRGEGTDGTAGEDYSPKMQYAVGGDGVVTVTVTADTGHRSFFTTLFDAPSTADLSRFAGGSFSFEVQSDDWGRYGQSGTANGLRFKVDHAPFCGCDQDLDVSGIGTAWKTFDIPISDLGGLQLNNIVSSFVLYPNIDYQVTGGGATPLAGNAVTFKIRNVSWVPPAATLTGLAAANVTFTTADINLTSDAAGIAYVAVLADGAPAPAAAAVKAAVAGTGGVIAAANAMVTAGTQATVPLAGLVTATMYDAYVVVEATAGGFSVVEKVDLTAAAAATLTGVAAANATFTAADINLTSNAAGIAYVAVLADGAGAPDAAAVKAAAAGTGGVIAATNEMVTAGTQATLSLTGLAAGTMYDAYVVVEATAGGFSTVVKVDVDTLSAVDPHASVSLVSETTAPPANSGTPLDIFTGATIASGWSIFTYEDGAPEGMKNDSGMGQVTAMIVDLADGDHDEVIRYQTGTETQATLGFGVSPDLDAKDYALGTLQFDIRVADSPDDPRASYRITISSDGAKVEYDFGGQKELGANTWMTARVDLSDEGWAGLNLAALQRVEVFPHWGAAAGTTIELDNIRLYPRADGAPDLVDITETVTLYAGFGPYGFAFENNGGVGITACSASPALPAGLGVSHSDNGDTCEITGFPTAIAAAENYTITATADTHMPTATVRLEVAGFPATGDLDVIGSSGPVAPNIVDIASFPVNPDGGTNFGGAVNTQGEGTDGTAGEDYSPKMQYAVDDTTGVVTVTVTADTGHRSFFTTVFDAPGAADLSRFAGGSFSFEVQSDDWGRYGQSGTANGLRFKVDHDPFCGCDQDLDVSGIGTAWKTFDIPISDLGGLQLNNIVSSFVLYPNIDYQVTGGGATPLAGNAVTFKIRNVSWVPPAATLTGVAAANVTFTTADINLTSDAAGIAYVAVLADGAPAPAAAAVKAAVAGTGGVIAAANAMATAGTQATVPLAGLVTGTMYDAYVVVEATAGGFSAVEKVDLTTAAAAMLSGVAAANAALTAADINLTSDAAGIAYVAVLADGAAAPDAAAVKAAAAGTGGVIAAANEMVTAGTQATLSLTGLAAGTTYDAYVVVEATAGGFSAVVKVDVDTLSAVDPHASVSLVSETSAPPANSGTPLDIFTGAAIASGWSIFTYEDGAPEGMKNDSGMGQVTAMIVDLADDDHDEVIRYQTGTETQATLGFGVSPDLDAKAYALGTLQFDIRVADSPDDPRASYRITISSHNARSEYDFGGQKELGANTWMTARVDLSDEGWAGLNLAALQRVEVFPHWGAAAGATIELDNIRLYPRADGAPDLVDITETVTLYAGFGPYGFGLVNNGGVGITACSASPALPAGLGVSHSDNGDTCEITGSPTAIAAAANHTITATAGAHMPTATVRLEVAEGLPATGDLDVIGSSGPVAPNIVDIASFPVNPDGGTNFGGAVNTQGEGTDGTAGEDYSPKMQYAVDDTTGVVTVTVTADTGHRSFFTTVFDAPGAADLSRFAGGSFSFEVQSDDWGRYGQSGTANGLRFKVDHDPFCGCDQDLDVSGIGMAWKTFDIPISDLGGLQLNNIISSFVLYPHTDYQVTGGGATPLAGNAVTFKIRNVSWVPAPPAPVLTGVVAANVMATAADINLTSDVAGMAYVAVLVDGASAPTAAAVKAASAGTGGVIAAANVAATAATQATVPLTGLTAGTMYDAFVVVEATAGGFSAVMKVDVDTPAAAVVLTGAPAAANVTATTADINLTSDTAGTAYVAVLANDAAAPAAAAIIAAVADTGGVVAVDSAAATAGTQATLSLTGLVGGTMYDAYVVVGATAGGFSAVVKVDLTTAPAAILSSVSDTNVMATTADINLTSDVAGIAYVAVLADGAAQPSPAAIKLHATVSMATATAAAATQATVSLTSLMAETMYDAYVVVEATAGGFSAVFKVEFTTTAAAPVLTGVAAAVEATTADITLTSDIGGTAYVAVYADGTTCPDAAAIKAATVGGGVIANGNVSAAAATQATVPLTGLAADTMYDACVVVETTAGGVSAVMKVDVDTPARSSFDLREENDAFAFVVNSLYDNSEDSASIAPAGAEIPLRNPDDFFISACSLVSVEGEDVVEGAVVTSDGLGIPEGMQLEPSSEGNFCSFTGIPTEHAPLRTYGVSASVGGPTIGTSNRRTSIAEIDFKVATQAAPDFGVIPFLVLERGVDYTAAPYVLVNRGGFVGACVDDVATGLPTLPTGLSIGLSAAIAETSGGAALAETCQITGMASATLDLTDSDGSPNAYAFNTDATKEEDTKVQANYYVVAAATAGALTPEARPNGERLRTFYSAGGVPFPDAYGGQYFEGVFGGVELRFPSAGTITRCRLSDESEPLPPPFAVAPSSNGSSCIIGPRVAHSTEAPWTSFGPTDFEVIASSSQATAEPRALRLEAIVGDYEDPVLSAPTFPSGGMAGKVVIPMSNTKITPIPIPNSGGKLSGTWRHGCTATGLPAGLGVRIATEEDAGESLEEGETCVIYGTPGTVAAEATIGANYPNFHVGDRGHNIGFFNFTIEVTAP